MTKIGIKANVEPRAARRTTVSGAVRQLWNYTWWVLPGLLAIFVRQLFEARPYWAEYYAGTVRPWLTRPFTAVNNLLPFPLTQVFLLGVGILVIVLLARCFCPLPEGRSRMNQVLRQFRVAGIVLMAVFLLYMLFHGYGFTRQPVSELLDIPVEKTSEQDLYDTVVWARENAALIRDGLNEDSEGSLAVPGDLNQQEKLDQAWLGWQAASETYPVLSGEWVRPKGVIGSSWWSYTGVSGMFFPMTVEANVNRDIPDNELLVTALHEIAHVQGFAREDEANFLAFLTGIHHPDAYYQYNGWLLALVYGLNSLAANDAELWADVWAEMPAGISQDIEQRNTYWRQFDGPVKEQSKAVNDRFLQANKVDDGVKSYGRMLDLVIAYHRQMAA